MQSKQEWDEREELKMIELIPSKDQERLAAKLRRIRQRNVALDTALMQQVTAIIDEVRARGDAALVEYTEHFDKFSLQPSELRVKGETLREIAGRADASVNENPAVAAALCELGIDEIYAVGGAQAVAALAFGTETVPSVDKITGPGNKYVAAAKKLVFGVVGIDSIAGPSEVVVIADDTARASFVAADLLAQAEHSDDACAILITTSETLAREVAVEVAKQARKLQRSNVFTASLENYGAIIVVDQMEEACALASDLAPEHLEVIPRDEEAGP